MRAAIVTLIAALLVPTAALADELEPLQAPRPNPIVTGLVGAFDVVILRPLGLVSVAVGAAAFVPAAFLASPMGREGWGGALEHFVVEPGRNVFLRPIGDF